MINVLSLNFGLAFAPYFLETGSAFLDSGAVASCVIRQGGSSLILRFDGEWIVRSQNREVALSRDDTMHYLPTVQFRAEFYDVSRTSKTKDPTKVGTLNAVSEGHACQFD